MTKPQANPPRLSSVDLQGMGQLFRAAAELPDEDLPKLRWRLRTSLRRRATRPARLLRLTLVVGAVFCLGGVVGAVVAPHWLKQEPSMAPPASAPPPVTRRSLSIPPSTRQQPQPAVAPEPTAVATVSSTSKPHARSVARAIVEPAVENSPTLAPSPAIESPPPPSAIAAEQALLGRAMKALRTSHDPEGALVLLTEHARGFPEGAMASEASTLRVEALLGLGRNSEALSVLEALPLATSPHREEQFALRGELRAAAGRWREAKADFDESLRGHLPAASTRVRSAQERALWGRAAARSRLGDEGSARTDLSLYLGVFPAGRFAQEAAALLDATELLKDTP
jgi:hypothetical protein